MHCVRHLSPCCVVSFIQSWEGIIHNNVGKDGGGGGLRWTWSFISAITIVGLTQDPLYSTLLLQIAPAQTSLLHLQQILDAMSIGGTEEGSIKLP